MAFSTTISRSFIAVSQADAGVVNAGVIADSLVVLVIAGAALVLGELAGLAVDGEVDGGVEIHIALVDDEVLVMFDSNDELDMEAIWLLLNDSVDRLHLLEVADELL